MKENEGEKWRKKKKERNNDKRRKEWRRKTTMELGRGEERKDDRK